jgi:hypothetical protein
MGKVFAAIKKSPVHTKKAAAVNPPRDHKKFRGERINRPQRKARAF